ncbi:MAG: ABC transporter permease [Woeseiaceae bacterium]|nr:ABC transporter permease [Woeseiaceae bacterium]
MLGRIYAIFAARNREFMRDRGTLSWNIVLPVALMFGLSFVFSGEGRDQYTVGVLQETETLDTSAHPFLETRFIEFVVLTDEDKAFEKVERHQLDLLVSFGEEGGRYWINPDSPKGYFAERILKQADTEAGGLIEQAEITGDAIRYVDWVLPGILGMNMMFSCLFGVGYVVVRYRKNGFLKRLRATPLRPIEFIAAQIGSRMTLIMAISIFVYTGTHLILDTRMEGSYLTLLVIAAVGAVSLISMGLVVAARVTSEELAGGLLNMINWPMMLLSGVWFSLEGAGPLAQSAAKIFPLTHILDAARAVMLDGATFVDVMPSLLTLAGMSAVFLFLGARFFRWHPE